MSDYSDKEKLRCVERELKFRNHVYPRRIADGKMTDRQAEREIAVMEDIAADYVAKVRSSEESAARKQDEPGPDAVYRR